MKKALETLICLSEATISRICETWPVISGAVLVFDLPPVELRC